MQNATLAGGVSIGMSCSYNVEPWVPVLIGGLAGMLSSFGYGKIAECLEVITFHSTHFRYPYCNDIIILFDRSIYDH